MNQLIIPTTIIALSMSPNPSAKGSHHGKAKWAKVTSVEPITRTIEHSVPREECWPEQVRYEEPIKEERL